MQEFRDKFLQQVGNDLNTSMAVTLLYDVLKAKTDDATKLAVLADFDQVLSLSLLEQPPRSARSRPPRRPPATAATPSPARAMRDRQAGAGAGPGQEGQGLCPC